MCHYTCWANFHIHQLLKIFRGWPALLPDWLKDKDGKVFSAPYRLCGNFLLESLVGIMIEL